MKTGGVKIYQFAHKKRLKKSSSLFGSDDEAEIDAEEGKEEIELQPTGWELPIKTDDIDPVELAKRVRFESNNVIRFLTID